MENYSSYQNFNPTIHGLEEDFRLTDFTGLKGWGCKVPQKVLLKLLEGLEHTNNEQNEHLSPVIGMVHFNISI